MEQAEEVSVASDWWEEATAAPEVQATVEDQVSVPVERDLEVLDSVAVDSRAMRSQSRRK